MRIDLRTRFGLCSFLRLTTSWTTRYCSASATTTLRLRRPHVRALPPHRVGHMAPHTLQVSAHRTFTLSFGYYTHQRLASPPNLQQHLRHPLCQRRPHCRPLCRLPEPASRLSTPSLHRRLSVCQRKPNAALPCTILFLFLAGSVYPGINRLGAAVCGPLLAVAAHARDSTIADACATPSRPPPVASLVTGLLRPAKHPI